MKHTPLKSLAYFDVFNHPLNLKELSAICGCSEAEVIEDLSHYLTAKKCFQYKEYYSINNSIKELVDQRLAKENNAQNYFRALPFYTKIIKSFPFVRGVAVSGSLSKGVMYENGDIDYFIIAKKNRLWICRTLLILFKKIFLLNSRKYFCVNYFVDEDNLRIEDKNIFTAIEISHLLPVYNLPIFKQLRSNNSWVDSFFPSFSNSRKVQQFEGNGTFKSFFEWIINCLPADRMDLYFMQLTYKRWSKKFKNFAPEKFELTMRSNRGISKHHPRDFQNKVLGGYKERLHQLNLEDESPVFA